LQNYQHRHNHNSREIQLFIKAFPPGYFILGLHLHNSAIYSEAKKAETAKKKLAEISLYINIHALVLSETLVKI